MSSDELFTLEELLNELQETLYRADYLFKEIKKLSTQQINTQTKSKKINRETFSDDFDKVIEKQKEKLNNLKNPSENPKYKIWEETEYDRWKINHVIGYWCSRYKEHEGKEDKVFTKSTIPKNIKDKISIFTEFNFDNDWGKWGDYISWFFDNIEENPDLEWIDFISISTVCSDAVYCKYKPKKKKVAKGQSIDFRKRK